MSAPATAAERRALEDERDFLLRSLEDLDAELAAGDLSAADYASLRDGYTARAAVVVRALGAAGPDAVADDATETGEPAVDAAADGAAGAPRGRRRRRRSLLWGGVGLLVAAAAVLVASEMGARLPGAPVTGSARLGPAQQLEQALAQAQQLEAAGQQGQALALYRQVLEQDPTQEQALAEGGWLEYEAGVAGKSTTLLDQGQRDEEAAESQDPSAYAPHLYLGSMLLSQGADGDAASEYSLFLSSNPPVSLVQRAWSFIVKAYEGAGRPLPPAPPGVTPAG